MLKILCLKVEQGQSDKVAQILDAQPELIDQEGSNGQTPLSIAIRKGDNAMIELLANLGADVNKSNRLKQTPLWIAAFYNQRRTAEFLLGRGADINLSDKKGITPLMVAAQRGNLETIAVLLNNNANFELSNKVKIDQRKNGDSVFDLCKDYDTLQFVIQTLQIEEVQVKQPQKFKQKNAASLSNSQQVFRKQSMVTAEKEQLSPLNELVTQICTELQSIFNQQIQSLLATLLDQNSIAEVKARVSEFYEGLTDNTTQISQDITFQYEAYSLEMSRQLSRTLYSLLHHLSKQFDTEMTQQTPNIKMDAAILEEISQEEEPVTYRNQGELKLVGTTAMKTNPMGKRSKEIYQQLDTLNDIINSRIQNTHILK